MTDSGNKRPHASRPGVPGQAPHRPLRPARQVLLFAIVFLIAVTTAASTSAKGKGPIVEGGTLEFQLRGLSGAPVSSADPQFAGKVVLVALWGTWCPPCITEIPTFIELQEKYRDHGLVIVGIAFESEEQADERRAKLQKFVERQGINYLILDGGQPENFETALPSVQNIRGLPVEILIDRSGGVVASRNGYGFKKKWASRLTREIEELLSESKH